MKKMICYVGGLVLIALSAQQLYRSGCDSHVSDDPFLNGDTLYPAGVYEDLVVDGSSWTGWRYSAATMIYPDMVVYFIVRTLTGSVGSAMVVCSAVMFGLMLLSAYFLIRTMTDTKYRFLQTCLLLLAGALFLLFNARCGICDPFMRLPLILTFHGGETTCLMLDLALINYLIQAPNWGRRHRLALVGLFINTSLCVLSDRLLIGHLVIPGIAGLLLCQLLVGASGWGLSFRKIGMISGCLVSATMTGKQMLRILYPAWQDLLNYTPFSLKNAFGCLEIIVDKWSDQVMVEERLHVAATGFLALCLGIVLHAGIRRIMYGSDEAVSAAKRQLLLVAVQYLGMTAVTLTAVCYAGTLYRPPEVPDVDWPGAARYFIPILMMPYFLAAPLLCLVPQRLSGYLQMIAAVGLVGYALNYYHHTAEIPRDGQRDLWNFYPEDVRQIDAICEKYDLQYGLAGYWHARRYTLLSRRGVRVHQILYHPPSSALMRPFPWLSNAHWYYETPDGGTAPRYQFILVTEGVGAWTPTRKELIDRYGEPAACVDCGNGGMSVFIYNQPENAAFQQMSESDCHFLREKFRFQVGEKVRFPADALPSGLLGPKPPQQRTAVEGCIPAGLFSTGPYLYFREAGTYRISICSSSSEAEDPIAGWQLFMIRSNGTPSFTSSGPLNHGNHVMTHTEMTVQSKQLGQFLECRIHYLGKGLLTLHHLEIERIE